jgi:hypothetical protein
MRQGSLVAFLACFPSLPALAGPATQPALAYELSGRLPCRGEFFEVQGRPAFVLLPTRGAQGPAIPWVWYAPTFPQHPDPSHLWMFRRLLDGGIAIGGVDLGESCGNPAGRAVCTAFWRQVRRDHRLADAACLMPQSRGGLMLYNWVAEHPEGVACITGIYTVCDLRSFPGLPAAARAYGMEEPALAARLAEHNPVDRLAPLAAAGVPILHVHGDSDAIVPLERNSGELVARYRALGGWGRVIVVPGKGHQVVPEFFESQELLEFAMQGARAGACGTRFLPDASFLRPPRPVIHKQGTIDCDMVETTPVVFKGRLYRYEYVRPGYKPNRTGDSYFRFIDVETREATPAFAATYDLGCAHGEGDTMYVFGADHWGGSRVGMFESKDLRAWASSTALNLPAKWEIFNTSVCRAGEHFLMAIEVGAPPEVAGTPFTTRFAESPDLHRWKLLPEPCVFTKDRYSACPTIRFLDGQVYMIYLEARPGPTYEPCIVRTRDLVSWETSPFNPVLRFSPEDHEIANPQLTAGQQALIAGAGNINNSDIDLCEFQGRTIINYSWGNQQGVEFLAQAVHDGGLAALLQGFFPPPAPRPVSSPAE